MEGERFRSSKALTDLALVASHFGCEPGMAATAGRSSMRVLVSGGGLAMHGH
jgi:hypothetical protein